MLEGFYKTQEDQICCTRLLSTLVKVVVESAVAPAAVALPPLVLAPTAQVARNRGPLLASSLSVQQTTW